MHGGGIDETPMIAWRDKGLPIKWGRTA
jgi:hypothetical protein